MEKSQFEWDEAKSLLNLRKHGVDFIEAQKAFLDVRRLILFDKMHSLSERRYFCIGKVNNAIMTVRFTYRQCKIRIFGAGYWRQGRKIYEQKEKAS